MVRHYKRKTTSTYDLETLKKAVEEVRTGKLNSYQAAKKYGIPRMTICDRVNKKKGIVKETRGPPTAIDTENELKLANGLRVMEKYGFGLSSKEVRELVGIHVTQNNYKTPFKNNQPGYDWLAAFKKRHNLSTKKPQAVEMSRKVAADPFIVNEYFDILEKVLDELDLKGRPEKVWNLDESSFGNDPDKTKIVGARGFASTRTIASSGKDNVTILFAASAAGDKLPPLIINRGKNTWDQWMSELGYTNTSYAATPNGWIDSKVFEKYMFKTVLPHLSEDAPALLIYDGHATHIQLKILEEAQKRGVTIIKLPSHASHLLQPLDLSVFKSMKNAWDEKLVQWQRLNVGKKLPKDEFSRIIGEVWRELNPNIIRNGFKKGGIYPFNRDAIPEEKFDIESLKRFKQFKTSRKEIPPLKELSMQVVLSKINKNQKPKKKTQITLNESDSANLLAASSEFSLESQEMVSGNIHDTNISETNNVSTTNVEDSLNVLATSSKLPLQSPGMVSDNINAPVTNKINIIEDRILSESEKVSFETLLLQKIKRSDSTVKLKKSKISKGCEVITREEFLEKKRKEEENKKINIQIKKEHKKAEAKPSVSLKKKKKTDKKPKKGIKKQKKSNYYDDDSEMDTSFEISDESCENFDQYLTEMQEEDFDDLREEEEPKLIQIKKEYRKKSTQKESEKAETKTSVTLTKKKKTDIKSKQGIKKQNNRKDYSEESEMDISLGKPGISGEDLDKYLEEMDEKENFENLLLSAENENEFDDSVKHDANLFINDEYEPNIGRKYPEVNDWILVRFTTKKSVKYFVGNIISVNENNIPNVKFLRKIKNSRFISFHYPDVEDISEVKHNDDIVMFLRKPDISRRGHVTFKENFKNYNIQ